MCNWHLPRAHYLEAWGDTRAHDGTHAPAQPLIRPLYEGRSVIELLIQVTETPPLGGHEIVRRTVRAMYASGVTDEQFEPFWRQMLNDGVLGVASATHLEPLQPALRTEAIVAAVERVAPRQALGPENLELVFCEDVKVYDGRFANNGWLQELPEIFTKVTWDNAVLLSPETAAALKVRNEDLVILERGGRRIVGPAYVMPGQAPFSVAVTLGHGRKAAGNVGNGVGFDAYPLRTTQAMHMTDGVTVRPAGKTYPFAMTQNQERISLYRKFIL